MVGFLDTLFKPAIFSPSAHAPGCLQRSVCFLSGVGGQVILSSGSRTSVLGHLFMEGLFSFPNVQFTAFLLAPYGIDDIALFVSWCFALGANQSLRVLEGLNCTGMSCFWRSLLNFSQISDRYGINFRVGWFVVCLPLIKIN